MVASAASVTRPPRRGFVAGAAVPSGAEPRGQDLGGARHERPLGLEGQQRAGASSKVIQRTSSNSWSWRGQVAADRLHQEVVDGLVDARPRLDEPVLDRVERAGDADLEPGLLARPRGARSPRGSRRGSACPSAGSRSGRRARAGDSRRRATAGPTRTGRRSRRRKWRSPVLRRATAPTRRPVDGRAGAPGAGPLHDHGRTPVDRRRVACGHGRLDGAPARRGGGPAARPRGRGGPSRARPGA